MRREWRCLGVAICALSVGAFGAQGYARLAAPYYWLAATLIAQARPWEITNIDVSTDAQHPGTSLRLHGTVRSTARSVVPAARVVTRVQAGAVIETPLVFWTIVLLWPNPSWRGRAVLIALAVPVYLGLEVATTVCQLLDGFASASAMLAGDPDPLTAWERWSRFLESGGRDVLAVCAALLSVALASRLVRAGISRSTIATAPAKRMPTVEPVHR